MRKNVFFLVFLVFLSINLVAEDFSLSAGGGGLLGYTFTRYSLEGGLADSSQSMDRFNYGAFVFFDATYAELTVAFLGGSSSFSENMFLDGFSMSDDSGTGTEMALSLSLMGKYPFKFNEKISWFPMLGVEYQIVLLQRRIIDGLEYDRSNGDLPSDLDKNGNPYSLSVWNSFWINIGAGMDYHLTSSLFLRSELLFGFRLPTTYEMSALEVIKNQFGIANPRLAGLTGGPNLKIGVGYRF